MRKSQREQVPEDPQEKNGEQERPGSRVEDLRKIFEPQETKRPQRKTDDHGKVFEVRDQIGNKIEPQERSELQERNEKTPVKSEDPQEKNEEHRTLYGEQGRPTLTIEPQDTNRPQRKTDDHGKVFGTGGKKIEKTPVKSVKDEQDIYKLQIKIDDLQKKMGDLKKIDDLQKQIGDLLRKLDKAEQDRGDLLRKLDKGEQDRGDLLRKLDKAEQDRGDLLRKLDKGEQDRGDLLRKLDKAEQDRGDLLRKLDKSEQDRGDLLRKLDKAEQDRGDLRKLDKAEQDRGVLLEKIDKIAQEKDILQHNLEQLKKEIEKKKAQFKSVWQETPLYADWRKEEFQTVNLTLDAATAHPALFLSEDGRRVTWQEPCQELPSCSQRFFSLPCVLGQLHVGSGRFFWEVEVGDAHSWDLGVCRDNVVRNRRVTMSPQNGFWAIRLYDGEYWGLTSPETSLTLKEKPCRVGVFLDYKDGDVSFYNMVDGSHIFTFSKQTFYGVLRPLFRLQSSDSGSLTIVQVE